MINKDEISCIFKRIPGGRVEYLTIIPPLNRRVLDVCGISHVSVF